MYMYVQMCTHNTVMNIDKDSSKKYVLYLSGPEEELVQLRTYIYMCKYVFQCGVAVGQVSVSGVILT